MKKKQCFCGPPNFHLNTHNYEVFLVPKVKNEAQKEQNGDVKIAHFSSKFQAKMNSKIIT